MLFTKSSLLHLRELVTRIINAALIARGGVFLICVCKIQSTGCNLKYVCIFLGVYLIFVCIYQNKAIPLHQKTKPITT